MKKLLSTTKFQIGFTLIELLIAVSIIVILISIGAVSYTTVSRNTRNAQRQSDLRKMAAALEEYYTDHHYYPITPYAAPYYYMQVAGFSYYWPLSNIKDISFECLLGGTYAAAAPTVPAQWTCTHQVDGTLIPGPYNVYYAAGDPGKIPKDPLAGEDYSSYYVYSSDRYGQKYVLVTECYEGKAPPSNQFTPSNPFYASAVHWSAHPPEAKCSSNNWSDQYAVNSPNN